MIGTTFCFRIGAYFLGVKMNSSTHPQNTMLAPFRVPFKLSDDHPRQLFLSLSQDHGVTSLLTKCCSFCFNRKRGKAKLCAALAWKTICQYSEMADGIYNKVIGDFNPFCSNDKDPWASRTDMCADYRIPYRDPKCTYFLFLYNCPYLFSFHIFNCKLK